MEAAFGSLIADGDGKRGSLLVSGLQWRGREEVLTCWMSDGCGLRIVLSSLVLNTMSFWQLAVAEFGPLADWPHLNLESKGRTFR